MNLLTPTANCHRWVGFDEVIVERGRGMKNYVVKTT